MPLPWVKLDDGSMRCDRHGETFRSPLACPKCAPALARRPDEPEDLPLIAAIESEAASLPRVLDHERWCIEHADDCKALAREYRDTSAGPAYMRVALSARLAAAGMADVRERRKWIADVERDRARSGSRAGSHVPSKPIPPIGADRNAPRRAH